MSKKQLLFIMTQLDVGGVEKSLITLLSNIDYEHFNVDLFLLNHSGQLMDQIPRQVNLLPPDPVLKLFFLPFRISIPSLLQNRYWKAALIKAVLPILLLVLKKCCKYNYLIYYWKLLSHIVSPIDCNYDTAIAYIEKFPVYFLIEKVIANKKIGWIHSDYRRLRLNPNQERPYFDKLDYIVTVSNWCQYVLNEEFPDMKEKIKVIYSIISPPYIKQCAAKGQAFCDDFDGLRLLTICRLGYEKGLDLAIGACKFLVDDGYKIRWYVIGEGVQKYTLQAMIADLGLETHFVLLGQILNPYPYLQMSDIYIQPSRYEGYGIALAEARALHIPPVVTDCPAFREQISNNVNGLIAAKNSKDIYSSIKLLIEQPEIRHRITKVLLEQSTVMDNSIEINKVYDLIGR